MLLFIFFFCTTITICFSTIQNALTILIIKGNKNILYTNTILMQNLKIVSLLNLSNYNKDDEVKMLKYI